MCGCREDGVGVGKKMAQVKLACRPASARLNTGDVVVGCPRFPTTTCARRAAERWVKSKCCQNTRVQENCRRQMLPKVSKVAICKKAAKVKAAASSYVRGNL